LRVFRVFKTFLFLVPAKCDFVGLAFVEAVLETLLSGPALEAFGHLCNFGVIELFE
jgi:hypothetical protein